MLQDGGAPKLQQCVGVAGGNGATRREARGDETYMLRSSTDMGATVRTIRRVIWSKANSVRRSEHGQRPQLPVCVELGAP